MAASPRRVGGGRGVYRRQAASYDKRRSRIPRRGKLSIVNSVAAQFRLASQCPYGRSFAMTGSSASLGEWQEEGKVALTWTEGDVWVATLNLEEGEEVQYKFLLLGSEGNTIEWLPGDNKSFVVPENAGLVEVDDSWTSDPPNVKVLEKAVSGSSAPPPPPATTPKAVDVPPPTSTAPAPASAGGGGGGGGGWGARAPSSSPTVIDTPASTYDESSLMKMRVAELRDVAKSLSMSGFSKLKKADLVALILEKCAE